MATAIGMVLTKKEVSAMPASGMISAAGSASGLPPSRWDTWPAACAVSISIHMVNSVGTGGLGVRELSVVGLHPDAAPTIIPVCGPRRISAAMSTTYDTDMFEPLAIANWTLNAEVSDDSRTRKNSGTIGVNVARGTSAQNVTAPRPMTKRMYQRARAGRSRSKTSQV